MTTATDRIQQLRATDPTVEELEELEAAREIRQEARRQERERIRAVLNLRSKLSAPAADYVTRRALDDDQPTEAEVLRELVEGDHLPGGADG